MKLSKDKRNRIILVAVIAIAVGWGIWQLVIKTRSAKIAAQRLELEKRQDQLNKAREWIERAQTIEREMKESQDALADIEARLGNRVDPYSWSYVILDLIKAEHKGLKQLDVTGKPVIGPVRLIPSFPYEAATFTVSGRGFYHDFGKFVADFENDYPYFRIENIELASRAALGGEGDSPVTPAESEMLTFKFDVVAPVRPQSN